jgi:hypothetical protein
LGAVTIPQDRGVREVIEHYDCVVVGTIVQAPFGIRDEVGTPWAIPQDRFHDTVLENQQSYGMAVHEKPPMKAFGKRPMGNSQARHYTILA